MRYIFTILILIFPLTIYSNNLNSLKESWLNNSIDSTEFVEKLTNIQGKDVEEQCEILLYQGKALYLINNKKESIKVLEEVIEISEMEIKRDPSSNQLRILSEAGTYLMLQKGVSYIIANSKDINNYAIKSLEMDKSNYRAEFIIANGLINAPAIFGGDFNKGIESLKNIITNADDMETLFDTYLALSIAYTKKDKNEAIKYCNEALKLYPKNIRANDLLNSLKG
ncbi:MAG: hypothetical protein JXR64_05690 [Spirochaetales bacterium]|nr:hypothetical protein [Spirochaetales bacterium]